MNNKILIVNQNSGYLTVDVANAFAEKYNEVVVMYGRNRITDRQFNEKIKIQKTIAYNRTNQAKRLFTWGLCAIHLFFLILFKYRNYSILYYTNPPMAYINSIFFKNRFGIVVFDTYPDALKLIGLNENNLIYKWWININNKVFLKAEKIITLSVGMKEQLTKYVNESKIKVVSIWPASEGFKPISKNENKFIRGNGFENKFIVLYSGNMGLGHQLEVLIEVADNLKEKEDILFLFVGEGAKKSLLMQMVTQMQLTNVTFLTWQDADILPHSLASGDIAVVALEPEATHASVPSKTFNYLAVGAPLLGLGNAGSELEKIIVNNNLGYYVINKNVNQITKYILDVKLSDNLKNKFSENAIKTAAKYTCKQAYDYVF